MKVYACPKGYEVPTPDYRNYDHKKEAAAEAAHRERLKKHLIDVGYTGEGTGGIASFGVADGQAQYMLANGKGPYGPSFLIHLAYGDGYQYAGVQHFPKAEILRMVKQGEAYAKLFQKADNWWEERKLGETVHYHNGFGQYVRGVIVNTDEGKAMKCTALVGAWKRHDLPKRGIDGVVYNGYNAQKVIDGETMKPNESNMFESAGKEKGHPDPTKLAPISFELPPMTAAEAELARLVVLQQKVTEALRGDDNAEMTIVAVKARLEAAQALLADIG